MPADFIKLAEETSIILNIGEWVLKQACLDIIKWHKQGYPLINISVNLSPIQFKQPNLVRHIQQIINQTKVDPNYLEFEITENVMMENMDHAIAKLYEIKAMGSAISIDDFGVGYSSMAYLKHLPIDTLKIDRNFIDGLANNRDDAVIVSAVIALGHKLGLKVVAEGIENIEQLNYLIENNCDIAQGYYFSMPVPADEFIEQFARQEKF